MAEDKKEPGRKSPGLEPEFIKRVCWPGNDPSKWCRYTRAYKGVWVCAKGTAAGERHSKRITRYQEEIEGRPVDADILFDAGEEAPEESPLGKKKLKLRVLAGDNCPGRADEFVHLFEDEAD